MDFGFRAGDGRRSSLLPSSSAGEAAGDGYFTAQALRAGFFGDAGRRGDLAVAPPQPPVPALEPLQRELQKDRFRGDMVGRELAHAREAVQSRILLEEEVRRELGLERVMSARRHEMERHQMERHAALFPDPVPARVMSYVPEARAGERLGSFPLHHGLDLGFNESFPLPHGLDLGFSERLPPPSPHRPEVGFLESRSLPLAHRPEVGFPESGRLPPLLPHLGFLERPSSPLAHRPEVGFPERLPLPPRPEPVKKKKQPWFRHEPREHEVITLTEGKMPWKSAGTKRKAATDAGGDDLPQPTKKRLSCDLCQVFTTSEHDLKWHLQGKKHKANEDALDTNKPAAQNSRGSTSLPADKAKEADKPLPANGPSKKNTSEDKQSFWCHLCKLRCYSQAMLDSHLSGKKHKAQLEEPGKDIKPAKDVKPVKAEESGKAAKSVTKVVKKVVKKQAIEGKKKVTEEIPASTDAAAAVATKAAAQ